MARNVGFGRFATRRQGPRRQSVWAATTWTSVTLGSNSAAVLTGLSAAGLALRPFTVVRTRGFIYMVSDQAAATESQAIIYGEIVVKQPALAIGVTAVPTPESESQADWHVFEPLASQFSFLSAVGFQDPAGVGVAFDSKAMRKVGTDDDLITVVEAAVSPDSEGVEFIVFSRALLKLH